MQVRLIAVSEIICRYNCVCKKLSEVCGIREVQS